MLAAFMVDGMPDATLFKTHVPAAIDRLCRGRKDCTIRAYGEMVDVLWQDGLTAAAIRLEMLWNQLAMTHDFSLLCGYAMGNFYKDAGMRDICDQHSHVIAAETALNPPYESSSALHVPSASADQNPGGTAARGSPSENLTIAVDSRKHDRP